MRRFFAVTSILSRGRTGRMYFWPIFASVCVYVIALSVLMPLFGAVERAGADDRSPTPSPAPTTTQPPAGAPPNFSIAVGTHDQPQEMPAIQSAMTDYLSFSDEFFTRLEQGAVAPDFSTTERELSPESALAQVEDGTSVLAVILPKDLTPQVIDDIRAYYRGDIDAPRYEITVLASPQALNEDKFILSQYRDQVIRQAEEHISEQIRIVARKFGCESGSSQDCSHSQDEAERAFERPFATKVEDVSGPPPVDYFSEASDDASPASNAATPGLDTVNSGADPIAAEPDATQPSMHATTSAIISALVLAAVTLATLSSVVVNRAAGLQVIIIGPWRSLSPQRPFSRRLLLTQKLGLATAGTLALTLGAGISSIWPTRSIVDSLGAYPGLRMVAIIGLLGLICLTVAIVVLAVTDTLGVVPGAVVAIGVIACGTIWFTVSGLLDPNRSFLWADARVLIGGNSQSAAEAVPTAIVLLVALAAAFFGSLAATRAFDRKFSTLIDRS